MLGFTLNVLLLPQGKALEEKQHTCFQMFRCSSTADVQRFQVNHTQQLLKMGNRESSVGETVGQLEGVCYGFTSVEASKGAEAVATIVSSTNKTGYNSCTI